MKSVRLLVKGATPLGLFPGYVTARPISAKFARAPDVAAAGAARAGADHRPDRSSARPAAATGRPFVPPGRSRRRKGRRADALRGDGLPEVARARPGRCRPDPRPWRRSPTRRARRRERQDPGRRFEVLLDRQLVLYIENGAVVRTLHVSSGARGFETPTGRFSVFRKETNSWSVPYKVGCRGRATSSAALPSTSPRTSRPSRPRTGAYGCRRYDAKWLYDRAPVGTAVTVLGSSR